MSETPNDPQLDEADIDAAGELDAGSPEPTTPAKDGTGVYSVYDHDLLRYVGGTHTTRKAADEVKRDRAGRRGRYEVREV